jgi:hypothetical protein
MRPRHGTPVPKVARVESVFVLRSLLVFWTQSMLCTREVGLIWFGLALHLL